MKKIIAILMVLGVMGTSAYVWFASTNVPETEPVAQQIEMKLVTFVGSDGTKIAVTFEGQDSALLRSDEFGVVRFARAVSASGARYLSVDGALELWNKGDEITLRRGEQTLFVGLDSRATVSSMIGAWRWISSVDMEGDSTAGSSEFVLTFTDDATVSVKTDCNSFGGAYDVAPIDGSLSFGPMAGTKMFCEGSRETEFVSELARVTSFAFEGETLVLVVAGGEARMNFSAVR